MGADEAAARGVFAPVHALSFGPRGTVVVAPGDTRGTVLIPERCDGYCMGLDGRDGPNLACEGCGREVATRVDDCSLWQAVRFAPDAVRRVPVDGGTAGVEWPEAGCSGAGRPTTAQAVEWAAVEWAVTAPVEHNGWWDPRWEAAVGAALAHLLAASGGAPVDVPEGLLAGTFGRALDPLGPPGRRTAGRTGVPPPKQLALAGPGLAAPGASCDLALVPWHPRTGAVWRPPGGADAVPLAPDVWAYLAFHHGWLAPAATGRVPGPLSGPAPGFVSGPVRVPVPSTGGLPEGVLRDDPPPLHPHRLFAPDSAVFLATLARLPAVRQPWLRALYDRVRAAPNSRPF